MDLNGNNKTYNVTQKRELKLSIPNIIIKRNDNIEMRNRIMSINPKKREELRTNKSTLWCQQKKIKEGKDY